MVIIPAIIGTKLVELSVSILMGAVGSIVGDAVKPKFKSLVNKASARLGKGLVLDTEDKKVEEILELNIIPFTTDLVDLILEEIKILNEEISDLQLQDTDVIRLVNEAVKQTVDYTLVLHTRSDEFREVIVLREELQKNRDKLLALGVEEYNLLLYNINQTLEESFETIEQMIEELQIDHVELKEILSYILIKIEEKMEKTIDMSTEEVIEHVTKSTETIIEKMDETEATIVDRITTTTSELKNTIEDFKAELQQKTVFLKQDVPSKVTRIIPPQLLADHELKYDFDFIKSYSILDVVGIYFISKAGLPIYGELYEPFPVDSGMWTGLVRATYDFLRDATIFGDPIIDKGRYNLIKMGEERTLQFWGGRSPKTGDILVLLLDPKVPLTNYEKGLKNHVIATMKEIDDNNECQNLINDHFLGGERRKRLEQIFHTILVSNLGTGLLFPLKSHETKIELCPPLMKWAIEEVDRPDGFLLEELWNVLKKDYSEKNIVKHIAHLLSLDIIIPSNDDAFYLPIKKKLIELDKLPSLVIILPEGLPPGVKVFDPYVLIEKKWPLSLLPAIQPEVTPSEWITQFQEQLTPLIQNPEGKKWLRSRILKLAYGTRGLERFDFLDAIVAVPPLESVIKPIQEQVDKNGKAGVFAKTGMGKSRTLLYLSHWWTLNHPKALILFIDHPSLLLEEDWDQLKQVLEEHRPRSSDERWLLIIDDIHRVIDNIYVQNLIAAASPQSYSLLIAFTEEEKTKFEKDRLIVKDTFQWLRENLSPLGYIEFPNLTNSWPDWSSYFYEWISWAARIVLDQQALNAWGEKFRPDVKEQMIRRYNSPWAIVIALGFLKKTLEEFIEDCKGTIIQPLLYGLIALLYLKTGETGVELSQLEGFLSQFIGPDDLRSELGSDWENEVISLIKSWTTPYKRLLPPLQKRKVPGRVIVTEPVIDFYHREWADHVCKTLLENEDSNLYDLVHQMFQSSLPDLYHLWQTLTQTNEKTPDFLIWFRDSVGLRIDSTKHWRNVYLDLSNQQLSVLPEQITEMIHLEKLYLENNRLSTIPKSIAKLSDLKEAHLNDNHLAELPEAFIQLTNLQKLYLHNNQLQTLPQDLGNLSNLRTLWLDNNNLTSLPKTIDNLNELEELCFSHNQVKALPKNIGNLRKLKILHADSNEIASLPKSVEKLTSITTLNLGSNQFTELTKSIGNNTTLEFIYLGYNLLTSLPKTIGKLINLKELHLYNNRITSLPKDLSQLQNLEILDLVINSLTSLPKSLGDLIILKELNLYSNQLETIPKSVGNLKNLQILNLGNNKLKVLPESIGDLVSLKKLTLFNNRLISLPESIGNLSQLEELNLRGNPVIANLKAINNLENLQEMDLSTEILLHLIDTSSQVTLTEMFQEIIPEIFNSEKAKNYKGLVQFIIEGDQPQAIYIDKGTIEVKSEVGEKPTLTIIVEKGYMLAMLRGMIHPRELLMKGHVKLVGKRALFKLWKIFKVNAIVGKIREIEKAAGTTKAPRVEIPTSELFKLFKEVFVPQKAGKWEGVIQFDIPEEPYAIYVKKGKVDIKPEKVVSPNLTITTDKESLHDIAKGVLDPMVAGTSGLIKADNMKMVLKFIKMFNLKDLPSKYWKSFSA